MNGKKDMKGREGIDVIWTLCASRKNSSNSRSSSSIKENQKKWKVCCDICSGAAAVYRLLLCCHRHIIRSFFIYIPSLCLRFLDRHSLSLFIERRGLNKSRYSVFFVIDLLRLLYKDRIERGGGEINRR
jgi:hypothetical protein